MTEIPEHLLKRSRERRGAIGGDEASGTPAASAPAKIESAAAAPAVSAPAGRAAVPAAPAAPKPKPDTPVVAAYKRRKRVPFWAMAALSFMPVWGFMYARSVTASPEVVEGALGLGTEVYGACASCHGANGQGGVGYAFAEGEVLKTFPHIEDQLRYVYFGTAGYNLAAVEIYGNPDREGGAHVTGNQGLMPNQGADTGGALTDYELLGVVCHERYTLGGTDPAGEYLEEFEKWCSEESPIFTALEGGETTLLTVHEFDATVMPIGPVPVPGSPPSE